MECYGNYEKVSQTELFELLFVQSGPQCFILNDFQISDFETLRLIQIWPETTTAATTTTSQPPSRTARDHDCKPLSPKFAKYTVAQALGSILLTKFETANQIY